MGIFDVLFGTYSKRELAKIEPIKNKVLALDEESQLLRQSAQSLNNIGWGVASRTTRTA